VKAELAMPHDEGSSTGIRQTQKGVNALSTLMAEEWVSAIASQARASIIHGLTRNGNKKEQSHS